MLDYNFHMFSKSMLVEVAREKIEPFQDLFYPLSEGSFENVNKKDLQVYVRSIEFYTPKHNVLPRPILEKKGGGLSLLSRIACFDYLRKKGLNIYNIRGLLSSELLATMNFVDFKFSNDDCLGDCSERRTDLDDLVFAAAGLLASETLSLDNPVFESKRSELASSLAVLDEDSFLGLYKIITNPPFINRKPPFRASKRGYPLKVAFVAYLGLDIPCVDKLSLDVLKLTALRVRCKKNEEVKTVEEMNNYEVGDLIVDTLRGFEEHKFPVTRGGVLRMNKSELISLYYFLISDNFFNPGDRPGRAKRCIDKFPSEFLPYLSKAGLNLSYGRVSRNICLALDNFLFDKFK